MPGPSGAQPPAAEPPLAFIPTGVIKVSGSIARIEIVPGAERITLAFPRLDGGPPLPRAVRIKLRPDDPARLQAGEVVQCYAMLFGPDRPAYPDGWDQGRDDFFSGLNAAGFALNHVTIISPAPPDRLADALQNLRAGIAANIMATLPPETGAIAVTLLTGDEQAIPLQERQNFIEAGLAHILAVAGLHVGIIMGLAFAGSRYLLTRNERMTLRLPTKAIAAALALLAGVGYAALTGAHLPIIRSLAMASLATLGVFVGRRAVSLRGLAVAAVALMPLHAGALALIPMGWGIRVIVWITAQIAQWPDAMLRIAPMPPAAILLIAAGLVWLCIWRSTPRLAGIPVMALGAVLALLARPPDVLVSPDARLIAIRSGGTVFLITQRKGDRFTLEQWAPVWGQVPLTPAECTENTCRVGPVLFAAAPLAECTGSAIAVSPVEFTGCAGLPVIDRLYVYRNGATAAWVNGTKVTLRTDRAVQGLRPWVAPYPQL